MRRETVLVAAFLMAGSSIVSSAALAQSSLPWSDANPLDGSSSQKAKPKAPKPAASPEPAAAAGGAEVAKPAKAPAPAPEPPDVPVPSPDPRPAKAEATIPPAPDVAAAPAADAPDVVTPPPAETKPVEEIPLPEKRPEAPAVVPPAAAAPKAAEEGQGGVEPAKPDDAPNSTEKLRSREPVIDPATSVVAAAAIEDARNCEAELKRRGGAFAVSESISEGECGVLRPVSIERLSSGVKVGPKTQMLCRAALALDIWMSDAVVPAAKASFPDRKLTEFRQASTYVCRPRASESGISEHARGSAIDIGAFVFDKGEDIGVAAQADGSPEARFQDAVRTGACGPFKTVLGPGTDPDHATHFHLDIAARKNGATYCK